MRHCIISFTLLFIVGASTLRGADFLSEVRPFLEKHCYACHDARKAKAGFRVDQLGADMLSGKTADMWLEVMYHVNLGEMPPEDEPRPDPKVSFAFVSRIADELRKAEKAAQLKGGACANASIESR